MSQLAQNRRARHDYEILETFEAGLVLVGTEVKSVRQGKASLAESYARVKNGEIWLVNCHIHPYEQGNRFNVDPRRDRKCLLHKREIEKLIGKVEEKGMTLIPLALYLKNRTIKLSLGLGKSKKHYDKRRDIKEKDVKRQIAQAIKVRS
jgi:SsrA-binding protein